MPVSRMAIDTPWALRVARSRNGIPDRTCRAGRAVGALRFGRFGWVVGVAIQTFRWRQQC